MFTLILDAKLLSPCCVGLNSDVKLCIGVCVSVSGGERSGKKHLLSLWGPPFAPRVRFLWDCQGNRDDPWPRVSRQRADQLLAQHVAAAASSLWAGWADIRICISVGVFPSKMSWKLESYCVKKCNIIIYFEFCNHNCFVQSLFIHTKRFLNPNLYDFTS